MGTWTALTAARAGRRTLLVDLFGPGDVRAPWGDESRIIRSSHGTERLYPVWAREAREAWIQLGDEAGSPIFEPAGVAWFAHRDDGFEADSETTLRSLGIPVERVSIDEASRRWPIATNDLRFVLFEPEAGALRARQGVRIAAAAFHGAGGAVTTGRARVGATTGDVAMDVELGD